MVGGALLDIGIIVAERDGDISLFDNTGAFVRSIARRGEGPGEFESIGAMFHDSAGVVVFDRSLLRATDYDNQGMLRRTRRLELPPRYGTIASVVGRPSGGGWVAEATQLLFRPPRPASVRPRSTLVRFDSSGVFVDTITSFLGSEIYTEPYGRAGKLVARLPWARQTGVVVRGDSAYIVDNIEPSVSIVGIEALGRRTLHVPNARAAPWTQMHSRMLLDAIEASSVSSIDMTDVLARMEAPSATPFFGRAGWRSPMMLSGTPDGLFLLHFGIGDGGSRWAYYSWRERRFTELAATQPFEVLDGRSGRVLVVVRDSVDVERVEVWTIGR